MSVYDSFSVIVIAHRLSTIAGCDRIYVMDNGHIVQEGAHKQLIQQEGLYRQLTSKMSL